MPLDGRERERERMRLIGELCKRCKHEGEVSRFIYTCTQTKRNFLIYNILFEGLFIIIVKIGGGGVIYIYLFSRGLL